jgi:hypothetical protein
MKDLKFFEIVCKSFNAGDPLPGGCACCWCGTEQGKNAGSITETTAG